MQQIYTPFLSEIFSLISLPWHWKRTHVLHFWTHTSRHSWNQVTTPGPNVPKQNQAQWNPPNLCPAFSIKFDYVVSAPTVCSNYSRITPSLTFNAGSVGHWSPKTKRTQLRPYNGGTNTIRLRPYLWWLSMGPGPLGFMVYTRHSEKHIWVWPRVFGCSIKNA